MSLLTVEDRVKWILQEVPETRSDDRYLQEYYLWYWHRITTFAEQSASEESPTTESIRRCRQKIQANGEFLADNETQIVRDAHEEVYREYARL